MEKEDIAKDIPDFVNEGLINTLKILPGTAENKTIIVASCLSTVDFNDIRDKVNSEIDQMIKDKMESEPGVIFSALMEAWFKFVVLYTVIYKTIEEVKKQP